MTIRRYQSGEVDYDGHTSRRGDSHLREQLGFKRTAVAVARKLAVIMHTMLTTGEPLRSTPATA